MAKRAYHHGDLRAALLEAVRGLIERDGPDGFSIAEACRLAGVSTAAPYKHFRDRTAILRGVALAAMDRLRERLEAASAAHAQGSVEAIAAIGEAYVHFARAEPGTFRTMFALTDHRGDAELGEAGARTLGVVGAAVAARTGAGPDDPTTISRAYALWSFVHGHAFLTLDGEPGTNAPPLDESALMRMVGEAIVPPGGSAGGAG